MAKSLEFRKLYSEVLERTNKTLSTLTIPGTDKEIPEGATVILASFPNVKWKVNSGWYKHNGTIYQGWYFSSIPDEVIKPLTKDDLKDIIVITDSDIEQNEQNDNCDEQNCPLTEKLIWQIERAWITIDTKEELASLTSLNLPNGKMVMVNNHGNPLLYKWDTERNNWVQVKKYTGGEVIDL